MLIQKSVFKVGFGEDSSSHKKQNFSVDLKTLFKELKPNTTEKDISKFINDNLLRLGFEFSPTDIEFLSSFMENEGVAAIQPSVKPKTIMNDFNRSFGISFDQNVTMYLQISDLNFITPFTNPLSTIFSFY